MVVLNKVGTLDVSGDMILAMNIWANSARPWMHLDPATECRPETDRSNPSAHFWMAKDSFSSEGQLNLTIW